MLTQTVFQTTIRCDWVPGSKQAQPSLVQELPAVPVLPGTLLTLNLIVQERCVDLRQMSQVILSDLGATLQILRLAGKEYGSRSCTTRIEDYISDLGLDACMSAISSEVISGDRDREAIMDLWEHSANIAQYARLIAEETQAVNPEEAYLTGLLHALGSLPKALRWPSLESSLDDSFRAARLASQWSLPRCIRGYYNHSGRSGNSSALREVVRRAHLRSVV